MTLFQKHGIYTVLATFIFSAGLMSGCASLTNSTHSSSLTSTSSSTTPHAQTALLRKLASSSRPLVIVYDGPGSCPGAGLLGCTGAAEYAAQQSGFDVKRVGPSALISTSTESDYHAIFDHVVAWVQPGGGSRTFLTTATPELKAAIVRFVHDGGGYVGFCAGAFSATAVDGALTLKGLGIFPGKTYPYPSENVDMVFDQITNHFNPDAYYNHIYPVNWAGKKRYLYFEEGAKLLLNASELAGVEVMATLPTGEAISARTKFGNGRVYITGMHPEASTAWRTHPDLLDTDGLDYDLVQNMLRWAAGMSTTEQPVTASASVEAPVVRDGRYVGTIAHYQTTSHPRNSTRLTQLGTTELKATSYDPASDQYTIQITHTSESGNVQTSTGALMTPEFDAFTSGTLLSQCTNLYGSLNGTHCDYEGSNSTLKMGSVPFGVVQTGSVLNNGTVFTTTYMPNPL
jgi:glutamine amidotransferase-like uncharacterized protein